MMFHVLELKQALINAITKHKATATIMKTLLLLALELQILLKLEIIELLNQKILL